MDSENVNKKETITAEKLASTKKYLEELCHKRFEYEVKFDEVKRSTIAATQDYERSLAFAAKREYEAQQGYKEEIIASSLRATLAAMNNNLSEATNKAAEKLRKCKEDYGSLINEKTRNENMHLEKLNHVEAINSDGRTHLSSILVENREKLEVLDKRQFELEKQVNDVRNAAANDALSYVDIDKIVPVEKSEKVADIDIQTRDRKRLLAMMQQTIANSSSGPQKKKKVN